jgi:predicted nucleic acid-binding protein
MAWCFDDESSEYSDEILKHLRQGSAIVPAVWHLEVINVLRVGEKRKRISQSQAETFISLLNALPIEVDMGLDELPNRSIMDFSRKYSISAYDAAYLELALRKGLPLISFDKMLCEAAKKAGILIRLRD